MNRKRQDDFSAGEETVEPTKRRRVSKEKSEDILNFHLDSILDTGKIKKKKKNMKTSIHHQIMAAFL